MKRVTRENEGDNGLGEKWRMKSWIEKMKEIMGCERNEEWKAEC